MTGLNASILTFLLVNFSFVSGICRSSSYLVFNLIKMIEVGTFSIVIQGIAYGQSYRPSLIDQSE